MSNVLEDEVEDLLRPLHFEPSEEAKGRVVWVYRRGACRRVPDAVADQGLNVVEKRQDLGERQEVPG